MKDFLLDIVQHTYNLGGVDLVKVTGTTKETLLNAIDAERSVIIEAKFKKPITEFVGTFGMPNLAKLSAILGIEEYKEDAKISINTEADKNDATKQVPASIHFENKAGDFKNDYRFMLANIVSEQLKAVKFKGAKWGVDFMPTDANIQRLKYQALANSEEVVFTSKTENKDLKFFFGDPANHAGNFVFQANVGGVVSKAWAWPIKPVIAILSLPGDKTYKISDDGASMITVDSGIAEYNYIIPAHTK